MALSLLGIGRCVVKERPILFSGAMVRAILEGRKTQTRRIIKPQPRIIHAIYSDASIETNLLFRKRDQRIHCPYGKPGDRLWVRETFRLFNSIDECSCYDNCSCASKNGRPIYRVDCDTDDKWTPSIHMPRWASRITLEIVSVRAQRLQDMNRGDAMSEGCPYQNMQHGPDPMKWFRDLWESINGPGSWERNDFVWAIEFKEVKP